MTVAPPPVSVVMAVHNGASTVARAIASIQTQDVSDWELVVVNDGSTDDTADAVMSQAAGDPRVRLLHQRANFGLAASLNLAIDNAGADLLARMDADDVADPRRLRLQLAALEQHPELDVLGTAVDLVDDNGCSLGRGLLPLTHEELVRHMYRASPFYHPTVVFRRAFVDRAGGYDARLRRAQDQDLWLRTYRWARFANLSEPLLQYAVPRAPSLRSAMYGGRVLLLNAARERSPVRALYAGRFLAAAAARNVRVRAGER